MHHRPPMQSFAPSTIPTARPANKSSSIRQVVFRIPKSVEQMRRIFLSLSLHVFFN
jgi:hypothetical protein